MILISLDGTRPSDVENLDLPTFAALAERGAVAEKLVPVFPTNTFPNHATLVTGVLPEVHGIVGNQFLGPERGPFRYEADPSWFQPEPLWSIASRHRVVSASYHWVGSEGAWINGLGPRYWKPFSDRAKEAEKVAQILAWLDIEDAKARPRLITTWFRGADRAGHRYGPGSKYVRESLLPQDEAIGQLVAGLDARGAFEHTTLLIVSDHGMREVHDNVDFAAAFEARGLRGRIFGGSGNVTVSIIEEDLERTVELAEALGLIVYRRKRPPADLPSGVHLGNPRFGDLIVMAPPGVTLSDEDPNMPIMRGAHGYLPDEPDMAGLLIAVGRGVTPGSRLPAAASVDVTPTVLTLLGLPIPAAMEGHPIPGIAGPAGGTE